MLKKLAVLVFMGAISMAPTSSMSALGEGSKMGATSKIGSAVPVIRLASNDVLTTQSSSRKSANKTNNESLAESSNIPAQAWLIVTALFCFVMRSSRRVV